MRILWNIHLYPPHHNCGGEMMAHQINLFLMSRGWHARVILHQANKHNITREYNWQGVEVFPPPRNITDAFRWADVVCTHLDYTPMTIVLANTVKRPLIHFKHNSTWREDIAASNKKTNFVVFNSKWIQDKENYGCESIVLHPPCDYRFYD